MPGLPNVMAFLMVKVFPKLLICSGCQRRSQNNREKFLLMTGSIFFFFFACCTAAAPPAVTSVSQQRERSWMAGGARGMWKGAHLICGYPLPRKLHKLNTHCTK